MDLKRHHRIAFAVWLAALISRALFAQDGKGGLESLFSIGVGARGLGMGSTAAAFPDGPSAFYWNPAGMVVVEQRCVGLSLTTLAEGTQYNFLGYVHPTMTSGTFGIGVARIGTGGIMERDEVGGIVIEKGEFGYWWAKLFVSYAYTPLRGLSLGANLDVNRQVMGSYSTTGFGVDLGVHYALPFDWGLLKSVFLGLNLDNAIRPRLKLGTFSESLPMTLRAGLAKAFHLGEQSDRWLFLFDLVKSPEAEIEFHMGTEFSFRKRLFLRAGVDAGEFTFGMGLRYGNFHLDYGTSRIADPEHFPRSHRFTLVFYLGKSIPERKRLEEEARRAEIQRRFDQRIAEERQSRIEESLQAGREYLDQTDYFNARLEFSRGLREDRDNREAQELLRLTVQREQELQRQREETLLQEERARDQRKRDLDFVNARFDEGIRSQEEGDFKGAIEKWDQALERDPENPLINDYLVKARAELRNEINRLIASSDELKRQENISEAYKMLDRAKNQSEGIPELHSVVIRKIRDLDTYVDFVTNYQEAQQRFAQGDYEAAVRYSEKALEKFPENEQAKVLYRNALARARGGGKEMVGEVKRKYQEGIRYYRDGLYEEALKVWQEAQELDPFNAEILKAIESAKQKIELFRKKIE